MKRFIMKLEMNKEVYDFKGSIKRGECNELYSIY